MCNIYVRTYVDFIVLWICKHVYVRTFVYVYIWSGLLSGHQKPLNSLTSYSLCCSFEQVFKVLPQQIPDRHHTEPYCSHIIDLPYSMMAMDHLPGVQMRTEYESMKGTAYSEQEPELIKVCTVCGWVWM